MRNVFFLLIISSFFSCKQYSLTTDVYPEGSGTELERHWYENGQLKQESTYKNGEQDGLQREWNENGQLMYEANFKNGEPDGLQFGTKMDN